MRASVNRRTDIVAFLLQLPTVKASIDHANPYYGTALSAASRMGHRPIVQLVLDTGADPTFPAGAGSPSNQALKNSRHAVAALLRKAIVNRNQQQHAQEHAEEEEDDDDGEQCVSCSEIHTIRTTTSSKKRKHVGSSSDLSVRVYMYTGGALGAEGRPRAGVLLRAGAGTCVLLAHDDRPMDRDCYDCLIPD